MLKINLEMCMVRRVNKYYEMSSELWLLLGKLKKINSNNLHFQFQRLNETKDQDCIVECATLDNSN